MTKPSDIRPSSQIRQDFLDFFKSKQHTIVPSSSLMPDSPNLLFTNAGMNQFVPIFLGQVKCPYAPPRAADTQKCIRAGGKHNDLDDVGLDTYHHTFFEMLGNWSFGDYFKQEAIDWAWELITEVWKFPKERLYATVYSPDKSQGDPSEFDQEAHDFWAAKFTAAGLDPKVHIVNGNKKDNFWMMGETGPCGPCSELHVDLTPDGKTEGKLVNKGDARCIEIWNLVFIQFNANPDGTFSPLPARHVDTGMGFERVTSIIQGTNNFKDFAHAKISNYETDIFRPIFDALEKMSGKKYGSTLPEALGGTGDSPVSLGDPPSGTAGATGSTYSKRNLPHFEKPWAIYHVIINTIPARKLSAAGRDMVFDCILHWRDSRYRLVAACVMPEHAHFIIQPGVKEEDKEGNPVFWPLSEILHSIKSYSAKEINKLENVTGTLWQDERYDRYIRSDRDLQEKFDYLCRNPWAAGLVRESEPWPWLWTADIEASKPYVPLGSRKGGTADPPDGTGASSQTTAGLQSRASSHSAGPVAQQDGQVARSTSEQIQLDIAFRVIADHIRTLSFAIADGIQPGNTDRNYVLRRILRRAVRYGRTLGFHEPFFYKLVDVLAEKMGHVFPEIRAKQKHVQEVIQREEEAFNKTLDIGIEIFEAVILEEHSLRKAHQAFHPRLLKIQKQISDLPDAFVPQAKRSTQDPFRDLILELTTLIEPSFASEAPIASKVSKAAWSILNEPKRQINSSLKDILRSLEVLNSDKCTEGDYTVKRHELEHAIGELLNDSQKLLGPHRTLRAEIAFLLNDTYGFPFDLIELMARERGLTVDKEGFEKLMEEQRARARAAQKKEVISISQIETTTPTKFIGYDTLETPAKVLEVVGIKDKTAVILDTSACYAEMGGQVGDTGELEHGSQLWAVTNTQKSGNTWLHFVESGEIPVVGAEVTLSVDKPRRNAIQRHHTVTHLLHWALHEVVSKDASQKGSFVGPDKLTFDFNSQPLTPAQVSDVEKLVNERILENAGVSWTEVPYADVKSRKDVMQFFGDKYGDRVRVVQIGGQAQKLDGYSMELCGGTHTRATGEIGLFRIVGESAIAAGVRRIEAVAGLEAYRKATDELHLIKTLAGRVNSPVHELEKKIEALLAQQKELEKQIKSAQQREAANAASELLGRVQTVNGVQAIIHNVGAADGDFLQAMADSLKGRFEGVVVLGGISGAAVVLVASVSADFTGKFQAGKIIQAIAPIVGGKGGGKPDNARGGGKDAGKLDEALAKAKSLLG
ncbi:MAG TPA: alanine--tRNA ligase-related protein [Verrucomicrobiae bacterium]|jgi:alanyl-tRNA synthetase/REP element-mobilizing transposase RayT|nr:alanine--tRNA ligase-related protein [Verrucomicrobiae bacterium]